MAPVIDIREQRINLGLSVADAAEQMGVTPQTLDRAERGEHRPQPRHAFRIAKFYGYKVTDLWPLEDEPTGAAA